jgi:hypothetical protein
VVSESVGNADAELPSRSASRVHHLIEMTPRVVDMHRARINGLGGIRVDVKTAV